MGFDNFSFAANTQLYFGAGKFKRLPRLIQGFGKNLLLISGGQSFRKTPQFAWLMNALETSGVRVNVASIPCEPSPGQVDELVQLYGSKNIQVVVGVGGGSVMDGAKAVSAMLLKSQSVVSFLEGKGTSVHDGEKIPFIAVPTTAGTGSEATQNAVLSQTGKNGFKKSLRHSNFVPDMAVVDPELTLSCPGEITAACGMDALTQLLESYVSPQASPMTDSLAEGALDLYGDAIIQSVITDPFDLNARTRLCYGSYISGLTLANAGLGVVHGFASAIGGLFPIPHGVICGTLLGQVIQTNIQALIRQDPESRVLLKYARAGALLSKSETHDPVENARILCERLNHWIEILRIPRLGQFGVSRDDMGQILGETRQKNNPVKLNPGELESILIQRI